MTLLVCHIMIGELPNASFQNRYCLESLWFGNDGNLLCLYEFIFNFFFKHKQLALRIDSAVSSRGQVRLTSCTSLGLHSRQDCRFKRFISYVYGTVHHLYSWVKRKNQLDATYFIIYSILIPEQSPGETNPLFQTAINPQPPHPTSAGQ